MLRLFHAAQANDLDIHPNALRWITRELKLIDGIRDDPEANRLFLEMLTSRKDPETTLRRLNEAGVFGRFVPDFGRVVAQMQHDMYHVFTVDEHTIFAIGMLQRHRGRQVQGLDADRVRGGAQDLVAPRALRRAAAARHRQGPRRRPFGARRRGRAAPGAALRADAGGDRDRRRGWSATTW